MSDILEAGLATLVTADVLDGLAALPDASIDFIVTSPPYDDLIEPCVLAGCPVGGVVLDPFGGAGTTGLVANRHGRHSVLCELNPEYAAIAHKRLLDDLA